MNTFTMASNLATARIRNARGSALLDVFAVVAFSVSAWLLLTVLGGVWMFYNRMETVGEDLVRAMGVEPGFASGVGGSYFGLAIVALSLLIVPLLSLGAAATRLGANGRSRRLASLRLIGMSALQVNLITIVETALQALAGFTIGIGIYLASLPLWENVSFTSFNIASREMLLPWWGFIAAFALVALITLISTVLGLRRVSITPLGVSRRETPAVVKHWRAIGILVVFPLLIHLARKTSLESTTMQILGFATVLTFLFLAVSIAGPWFIQVATRPFARTGNAARLLGARRVIDNPQAAWRTVSAISLMGLVASIVVFGTRFSLTVDGDDAAAMGLLHTIRGDIVQGVAIALAVALILGATSTLIQQTSDVFDRLDEAHSLHKMGMPPAIHLRARLWQVMPPLLLMLAVAIGIGAIFGIGQNVSPDPDNLAMLGVVIAIGVVLTFAAVLATVPIQRTLLRQNTRRND
ncbi:hypothetical protein J2S70_001003 [Trueperella bonasi]|uniref:ABC3 transporter permease C-terminal domain-containing protein n=1 Tax=Trueperella bonasi TaxID=312286 RepID=A0ABT9NG88_9ACTO|nr:FtsX-like permease family protein [Trueperella bonasi]MDP9806421.1 hypothetical protein [Trueperella bonasi]